MKIVRLQVLMIPTTSVALCQAKEVVARKMALVVPRNLVVQQPSPSPPPPLPSPPPPLSPPPLPVLLPSAPPPDGAVLELTGNAPTIKFGPELSPVCSLKLDSANNQLESTCAIHTPAGRRLEDEQGLPTDFVSRMEHEALVVRYKALRTEVAELRRILQAISN